MAVRTFGTEKRTFGTEERVFGGIGEHASPSQGPIPHTFCKLDYPNGESLGLWTGPGPCTINGFTYSEMKSGLISVSDLDPTKFADDQNRVTISVILPNQDLLERSQDDPGIVVITLQVLITPDQGDTWYDSHLLYEGRLSQVTSTRTPENEWRYDIEIADRYADLDRHNPAYWSDAWQRSQFNGDKFFSNRPQLESGEQLSKFAT